MTPLHRLKVLDLNGQFQKEIKRVENMRYLSLYGNNLIGSIPPSLMNASRLETLDLSFNLHQGNIPEGIGNLHNVNWLGIQHNQLTGSIPFTIFNISRIEIIEFTGNSLSGSLPNGLCNGLPILKELYLSDNKLHGEIPREIRNLVELEVLSIAFNSFSGSLEMETFNISGLRVVSLFNNNLSGTLPSNIGSILPNIEELYLDSLTNLVETIPHSISNCSKLTILELSGNKLAVGNLSSLLDLDFSGNNMVGSIPTSIGNLSGLQRFNLSSNKFKGFIGDHICQLQHLGNLQDLVVLDLSSNNMVGSLPSEIGNLKAETQMDLSMNQFSNEIPREIGGLQTLAYLSFRHNKLEGAIPDSMSNMVGLEFLDLSHNNISGIIPKSLEKLQNLKKILLVLFLLLAIAVVFVPLTFVLLWIRYRRRKSSPHQADSLSTVAKERISYYELLRATNALIITSCSNLDFKALVLEYMPNGSLEKYLYSHNYFLDIKQRLNIMIDVACALEYLHHGCSSPVIHCDLKPSNVLLDEDMVSHLSDNGILKLLCEDQGDLYTKALATLSYIAQEYGMNGLVSTKCDVYSYGIMLLETLIRRKPNEFEGDLSLKQWVSYSLPKAVMDVVDANLVKPIGKGLQKELDVVASILKVALDCCAESPARRTNMKDVVAMPQKIKIQLLAR
ncbi:hypothetical protein P3S67_013547 [Capsicum chacoense]